jgi:putative oxygen-independent coproporphyrinogen III oxidase
MITYLYIHIPFCTAKCSYCSFNSYSGLEALQERYVEALCAELSRMASRGHLEPLETIFMGGGTPSILPNHLLRKVLSTSQTLFPVAAGAEISIEINPGTVDMEKLDCLLEAGVNRISFGVQSFNDQELNQIGRIHSAEEAVLAVTMAAKAGFSNISLDLMYGLPGQIATSWQESLETAISLGVKHLSLYQLTVEEQTPLKKMVDEGRVKLPDEDELATIDEITAKLTVAGGLLQYEISNYAHNGYQCRHNIAYWENDAYLGIGAGAVSCVKGIRKRNVAGPVQYCDLIEAGKSVVIEEETLESEASFRETVIMGLRMNRGVSVSALARRYGLNLEEYYGETLEKLIAGELLELKADFLSLTDRGRAFANLVMAELV